MDKTKKMKLYSVQRRMERYRIIYLWKIIIGIVPNYGITWSDNMVRGRMFNIPRSKSNFTAIAKHMRDQSLIVHGGNIFNLLPVDIRNWSGLKDLFKEKLDMFIKDIPDCPQTPDLTPDPINRLSCKNSNSLFDWILHCNLTERRPEVVRLDEPCRIEY